VGDGLDSLRQEIREHVPRTRERKLADALRTLREEEAEHLRQFEWAREEGGRQTWVGVRLGLGLGLGLRVVITA